MARSVLLSVGAEKNRRYRPLQGWWVCYCYQNMQRGSLKIAVHVHYTHVRLPIMLLWC